MLFIHPHTLFGTKPVAVVIEAETATAAAKIYQQWQAAIKPAVYPVVILPDFPCPVNEAEWRQQIAQQLELNGKLKKLNKRAALKEQRSMVERQRKRKARKPV